MQIGGRGARAAVEDERHRPVATAALEHIGGVEDRGGTLAALFIKIERPGGRRIGELHAVRIERVLGRRIRRQQRKDAGALRVLLATWPVGALGTLRPVLALLMFL